MPNTTSRTPDLDTRRLRLRPLALEDAPALHKAYADAETMRFWDASPSRDLAETKLRLRQSVPANPSSHAAWAVLARHDGSFVGMVNYHARAPHHHRLATGWILLPGWQGRGYMHEALVALLGHCFATLLTNRIEAEIEPANERSVRLAERLGFRREGLLRDRLCVAGVPRTVWLYALLRSEWNGAAVSTDA